MREIKTQAQFDAMAENMPNGMFEKQIFENIEICGNLPAYWFQNCIFNGCKITMPVYMDSCTFFDCEVYVETVSNSSFYNSYVRVDNIHNPQDIVNSDISSYLQEGFEKLNGHRFPVYIGFGDGIREKFVAFGDRRYKWNRFLDKKFMTDEILWLSRDNKEVIDDLTASYDVIVKLVKLYQNR